MHMAKTSTSEHLMRVVTPPTGGAVTGSQLTSREVKSPSARSKERPAMVLVFTWAVHYKQKEMRETYIQFSKEDTLLTSYIYSGTEENSHSNTHTIKQTQQMLYFSPTQLTYSHHSDCSCQ